MGDENATDLACDFRDYKAGITSFGATFGRDKEFGWPSEVTAHELWHVHLEDEAASSTWDYLTENYSRNRFSQDNYTSDTMLVYGRVWDAYKSPYLLLTILSPDGHAQMDDRERMRALAAEYAEERLEFARKMPCSEWIIVE